MCPVFTALRGGGPPGTAETLHFETKYHLQSLDLAQKYKRQYEAQ